jgi:hypothetical protein
MFELKPFVLNRIVAGVAEIPEEAQVADITALAKAAKAAT